MEIGEMVPLPEGQLAVLRVWLVLLVGYGFIAGTGGARLVHAWTQEFRGTVSDVNYTGNDELTFADGTRAAFGNYRGLDNRILEFSRGDAVQKDAGTLVYVVNGTPASSTWSVLSGELNLWLLNIVVPLALVMSALFRAGTKQAIHAGLLTRIGLATSAARRNSSPVLGVFLDLGLACAVWLATAFVVLVGSLVLGL